MQNRLSSEKIHQERQVSYLRDFGRWEHASEDHESCVRPKTVELETYEGEF